MSETHKLNVIQVSKLDPVGCSVRCSHFDELKTDSDFSFCRLFGQLLEWKLTPGLVTVPVRCPGCFDDPSLKLQE
jgi:hypothetical protein